MTFPAVRLPLLIAAFLAFALFSIATVLREQAGREPGVAREPVTIQEAMERLADLLALAQEPATLCQAVGAGAASCDAYLSETGEWTVPPPSAMPVVVRVREPSRAPLPALIVEVEGTTGTGEPFQGDFYVIRSARGLDVPYPVFWAGLRVAS
jgi:hypothetical protein